MLKDKVIMAYNFSKEKHNGQYRKYTGEPYFMHPKSVARMLEAITKDEDMVCGALLHDVYEDCDVTKDELLELFGEKIANYVLALSSDKVECRKVGKANYLKNKIADMSTDVMIIKLADRLDNVRYMDRDCKTTEHKKFVKKYYLETLEILEHLKIVKDFNSETNPAILFLVKAIDVELLYLKIKYLW